MNPLVYFYFREWNTPPIVNSVYCDPKSLILNSFFTQNQYFY